MSYQHEGHAAHEGPCLPLANQADPQAPQGVCDDCGRIVREANRPHVRMHGDQQALPPQLLRQLVAAALAAQGLAVCTTCGQANPMRRTTT